MMALKDQQGTQLHLAGVERFPEPKNFSEAIAFLRRYCRVTQVWMQDADKIKITCKTSTYDEDIAKTEFVLEIPLSLPEVDQQKKLFEHALLVFRFWKEYEESKD